MNSLSLPPPLPESNPSTPHKINIRYNKNMNEENRINNVERHKKAVLKLSVENPTLLENMDIYIPTTLQTDPNEYRWPKTKKVLNVSPPVIPKKQMMCCFYVTNEYNQAIDKCFKCREDDRMRGLCQNPNIEKGFILARTDKVIYNSIKKKCKLPVVFLCRPSDQARSQELFVDIFLIEQLSETVEFYGRAKLSYRKGSSKTSLRTSQLSARSVPPESFLPPEYYYPNYYEQFVNQLDTNSPPQIRHSLQEMRMNFQNQYNDLNLKNAYCQPPVTAQRDCARNSHQEYTPRSSAPADLGLLHMPHIPNIFHTYVPINFAMPERLHYNKPCFSPYVLPEPDQQSSQAYNSDSNEKYSPLRLHCMGEEDSIIGNESPFTINQVRNVYTNETPERMQEREIDSEEKQFDHNQCDSHFYNQAVEKSNNYFPRDDQWLQQIQEKSNNSFNSRNLPNFLNDSIYQSKDVEVNAMLEIEPSPSHHRINPNCDWEKDIEAPRERNWFVLDNPESDINDILLDNGSEAKQLIKSEDESASLSKVETESCPNLYIYDKSELESSKAEKERSESGNQYFLLNESSPQNSQGNFLPNQRARSYSSPTTSAHKEKGPNSTPRYQYSSIWGNCSHSVISIPQVEPNKGEK